MSRALSVSRALSWNPVLRGKIYCSPACGYRCTLAAHNKAQQDATAVAERFPTKQRWNYETISIGRAQIGEYWPDGRSNPRPR